MRQIRVTFTLAVLLGVGLIGVLGLISIVVGAMYNPALQLTYGAALFVAGMVPISLFYVSLYSRLTGSGPVPSDGEIDSLYYLGFLITLVTLIVTVISTSLSVLRHVSSAALGDQSNLVAVSFAFALSLTATALALFARVQLASMKEQRGVDLSVAGLEEHVSNMVLQVDRGYSSLGSTVAVVLSQMESSSKTQADLFASEMGAVVRTVQAQVEAFSAKLSAMLPASGFEDSLSTLAASLRRTGTTVSAFATSLDPLPPKIAEVSVAFDAIRTRGASAGDELAGVASRIGTASRGLSDVSIDKIGSSAVRLKEHLDTLTDAIDRSEALYRSGLAQSSSAVDAATNELKSASVLLGRAFTDLASELAETARVLAGKFDGR